MPEQVTLEISKLRRDGGLQSRSRLNTEVVDDFVLKMMAGVVFTPVTVFYDGVDYWLQDGYHRVMAATIVGRSTVNAEVLKGSKKQALLYSVSAKASAKHQLKHTLADRRRAVLVMVSSPEWSRWPDEIIAAYCGVPLSLVKSARMDRGFRFRCRKPRMPGDRVISNRLYLPVLPPPPPSDAH